MTAIPPWGIGWSAAARADGTFRGLKGDLGALQGQLTTGKAADTYAGLGSGAATSLSVRSRLAAFDGYASNVSDAKLRLTFLSQGVQQVGELALGLTNSLPTAYNQSPIGQTTAEVSAEDGLRQVIDILNTDVSGRYLFSGRTADVQPVASYDLIVNGDTKHAGLKQLVVERKAADLGADGRGRLALATSRGSVTLSETPGLPFGFRVAAANATGTGLAASLSAGPPVSAKVAVNALPADGDTVSVSLDLPDGTRTTLVLTARSSPSSGDGNGFAIGANVADTAANLSAALDTALKDAAATTLASASTIVAAGAFFAGSATNPPARVAGPPYATATATVAGTAANTVIWYAGDDGTGSPRETSPVRTGDGTGIAIGARASEAGFRKVLTALGALVADTFSETDATSQRRYSGLADRVSTTLGGAVVDGIGDDLALANAALGTASDRLAATRAQLQDTLDGVENADPNAVASKLLATQTRLQASYQTTSRIAELSLVNYL